MTIHRRYWLMLILALPLLIQGCESQNNTWKESVADPDLLHSCVEKLTKTVVYDVFSPPVSSRVYAYPSIAAYEAFHHGNPAKKLSGRLNDFELPDVAIPANVSKEIAACAAFLETSKAFIFSENQIAQFQDSLLQYYITKGVPEETIDASETYGKEIAKYVVAWSNKDNYKESRSFQRYTPSKIDSAYALTPPDYTDALEPNWNKIRPLVMDSVSQFMPARPIPYSSDTASAFFKQAYDVYKLSQVLSD